MKECLNIINNLDILENEYIVLACSYGPDSMCLLDLLEKANKNIVIAHVNHKLREESNQEYSDLETYCKNHNIIFEGMTIDNYEEGNIENIARNKRYEFFEKIVKKYNARYLFTAHHGDDLVETILMRLNRGASLKGYAGFKTITKMNNYILVRPLINLTKEEIINYVNENSIPYAIDKTNLELVHTRNIYRHKLLPVLKEINPNVHKKFLKFSKTALNYYDYVQSEVNSYKHILYKNNSIDINDLEMLPDFIRRELFESILFDIYNNDINLITDEHIDLIINLTDNDKVNSYICLPNNLRCVKFYNILEFTFEEKTKGYDLILDKEVRIKDDYICKIDYTDIIKSNYLIRLNSKDIKLPIHVRSRDYGDKMMLKNGTKKIGEILSEAKISQKDKEAWPIVTDSEGTILWVPGVKKSKFDKQIKEDYDIILKYIRKEKKNEE